MWVSLPLLRTNKWNRPWSPREQMFLLTFGSIQSGELYKHDLTVLDKALCGDVRKDVGTKLWSHLCKTGWVNLSEKLQHFKKKNCNPLLNIILSPQQIRWCSCLLCSFNLCVVITGIDQNQKTCYKYLWKCRSTKVDCGNFYTRS